ncbi:MAG: hypothetical protein HYV63_31300 [Candidatus Schekmanbacteria bacterium]|nr:hypothetical protein [Candidatus Schekmanbacteria bacterium]
MLVVGLLLVVSSSGCKKTIQEGLTEEEANLILVKLKENNVLGEKIAAGEEGFAIQVPKDDIASALRIMEDSNLPRKPYLGIADVFPAGDLIPTETTEKLRALMALQGELANTIMRIEGVIDARVHVALPEADPLADPDKPASKPKASVLVKIREGTSVKVDQIQKIVANAVDGLDNASVDVMPTEITSVKVTDGSAESVRVLTIEVLVGSASRLRVVLICTALLVLVAGGVAVWSALMMGGARREAARLRAEREALRAKMGKYLKRPATERVS